MSEHFITSACKILLSRRIFLQIFGRFAMWIVFGAVSLPFGCGPAFPDPESGNDSSAENQRLNHRSMKLAGGFFDLSGEHVEHPPGRKVPGSWIVAFRSDAVREALHFANFAAESSYHQSSLWQAYGSVSKVRSIDFITALDISPPMIGDELSQLVFGGFQSGIDKRSIESTFPPAAVAAVAKVDFASDDEARSILALWESEGKTWFAEPNGISELYSTLDQGDDSFKTWAGAYEKTAIPHLSSIAVAPALAAFTSADPTKDADKPSNAAILESPPVIAVIDNGVDYSHPALKNRIFQNPSPGSSGCANDLYGCNVTAMKSGSLGNGEVMPDGVAGAGQECDAGDRKCPHGTHVAGIIAAEPDVSSGSVSAPAGVCPFCKILPIKATSAEGGISDASQLAGLKYVSLFRGRHGNAIRIVNASFGQFTRNRAIAVLVASLRRTGNGIVVVSAAGNEDTMLRAYPAALQDAIAVSAVDDSNRKAVFSNFGSWVDVAAPGVQIESTAPGGATTSKSGTSMAAPVVSGVLGLMVAFKPGISVSEMRNRIITTSDPSIYRGDDADNLNYRYYYARIGGEVIPRPLLGSGLVQAEGMIRNKGTGAFTSSTVQRVNPGCGMIAEKSGRSSFFDLGWLILGGVLISGITPFLRRSRDGVSKWE
jgi:subtilisin family serine protease